MGPWQNGPIAPLNLPGKEREGGGGPPARRLKLTASNAERESCGLPEGCHSAGPLMILRGSCGRGPSEGKGGHRPFRPPFPSPLPEASERVRYRGAEGAEPARGGGWTEGRFRGRERQGGEVGPAWGGAGRGGREGGGEKAADAQCSEAAPGLHPVAPSKEALHCVAEAAECLSDTVPDVWRHLVRQSLECAPDRVVWSPKSPLLLRLAAIWSLVSLLGCNLLLASTFRALRKVTSLSWGTSTWKRYALWHGAC